jgi:hypothetical protein
MFHEVLGKWMGRSTVTVGEHPSKCGTNENNRS